jgi:leukotriene-A4 hydrolase
MRNLAAIVCILFIIGSCNSSKTMEQKIQTGTDPHSYSRPEVAKVTHLNWIANVNFRSKVIVAVASWQISATNEAEEIIFDTKDLNISKVTLDAEVPATYKLAPADSILGSALIVEIKKGTKQINIHYQTSPDAEALQWLSTQQTAGKQHPFLFTQSQAILARSWVPCQDSPSIRFSYDADVTVPKDLLALMSASNPQQKDTVKGDYKFSMKQPISSYLLALAVGDLAFKPISDRSGIYAEPAVIEKAANEFVDLEKMIGSAEQLYGPYQWGRYDVLVLPPSFPFGGMENPRVTFATPTILAGDRSLTSLIAHELAHSWSGNLVTNATWNDFWLNEGFTVYFETRIMEKLYGKDYAEMLASLNLADLKDEINSLNEAGLAADTKLKLDLTGRNPDDGVTDIAYNKGYFFLRAIEEKYGRDKFDSLLKDYFHDNAFKSMDTDGFIKYIKSYYQNKFQITIEDAFLNAWIFTEGLPAELPKPNSTRFDKVDQVIAAWKSAKTFKSSVAKNWSTHEWLHFLKNLPDTLSQHEMEAIDNFGNFTKSGNAEIIAAWGIIAIRNNYEKMYPVIETFLINTGRRKFLSPLYSEMIKTPDGKQRAKAIYEKARPNYHFVATNTFDKLLNQ